MNAKKLGLKLIEIGQELDEINDSSTAKICLVKASMDLSELDFFPDFVSTAVQLSELDDTEVKAAASDFRVALTLLASEVALAIIGAKEEPLKTEIKYYRPGGTRFF